ncbi:MULTISPECIES: hypothetical protein [Mesorhizobium]|jgi:hypothetical protein|uniref:Uncharacterized protein n=3 Tax=Mesorhizobium TaxID=68287 RepID=A0A1R3V9B1_9HYPH|nr:MULTISPECIES: hypothetical protein [Mesorhizobium]MCF6111623.1 hypothetical protein [Mesorhizobium muleiense]MCF6119210.1 hypothetical protein [Mesorhizobium muleiense]RWA97435.1 MAG: hypothetical protein EOQ33_31555 [Mesorhizobium sp.]RWB93720.1 MAG: hypothetical protein EOQ56_33345 [Mesorhizobium sp.]RWK39539.1 MAG: hypothetical protein EOR46_22445 [Mesorhizobium sp.]
MNEDYELAIDHDKPYEITAFAKKHGLTTRAAELILFAYSPSRAACDTAATAFLTAVAVQAKRQSAR